ncbi:MAG: DUF3500 domain-containing protein [Propionibacteriaceae bacterium]|nr:DUF3500 domain-containing protein [Propionibacteriaceae bacterium]
MESLSADQRAAATTAFDVGEPREWTYLPGPRPGVCVADLSSEQRDLASALLLASYSPRGTADAERVIRVEAIRRGLVSNKGATSTLDRYGDLSYWLRILGDPSTDQPWAWRLSGHHLVAQVTVAGGEVAATPQFFGAEPARVLTGPHAGFRALPQEEDLARQLVSGLTDDQRRLAIISDTAPADIKSRHDPVATVRFPSEGLARASMGAEHRQLLAGLIRQYLDRAAAPIANRAWADLVAAGVDEVRFSWAGGTAPGQGHYYAVTGPTFLLEYDNTQGNANHIHSVWRDLQRDWAGDLLARHYGMHPHDQ